MQDVDIFDKTNEVSATWAKFVQVGDSVKGTYIEKREHVIDQYDNEQTIYVLKDANGQRVNVGVKATKTPFHENMKYIKLGQIIGIKLTEIVQGAKGEIRILKIFANPNLKDEEWLKGQKEAVVPAVEETENFPTEEQLKEADDMPFDEAPKTPEMAVVDRIMEYMKLRYSLTEADAIRDKIAELTGLAFIPSNFNTILEKILKDV